METLTVKMIEIIEQIGFPMAIAAILLWDKMKTNGSLMKVVENNNELLKRLENKLKGGKK